MNYNRSMFFSEDDCFNAYWIFTQLLKQAQVDLHLYIPNNFQIHNTDNFPLKNLLRKKCDIHIYN